MRVSLKTVATALLLLLVAGAGALGWQVVQFYRAKRLAEAAQQALTRRDFAEADRLLKRCLAIDPKHVDGRLAAAQSARRQNDLETADAHLEAYRKANGPPAALELERRLMRVQRGDVPDDEWQVLLRFCDEQPGAPEVPLVLEALLVGALRKLEPGFEAGKPLSAKGEDLRRLAFRAVVLWTELRTGEADQTEGMVWRGRLHLLAYDEREAEPVLREALARDPDHVEGRFALAQLLLKPSPREAVRHLRWLMERDPKDRNVRFILAVTLRDLGQLDEASAILDGLLADAPNHVGTLVERGKIEMDRAHLDRSHYAEAERLFRRAVGREPENADANAFLAACLQQVGKADEAATYRERAESIRAEQKRNAPQ